ncbi:MAG: P-loop NTPase [Candidatus Mcinerneyibacterium aminivorans]|uniref:P-loop NTPase n=1 Tax=Candidatus Mcinerneyibacterium aminivorans TaxID=2703815 RepID=A0A5D0MFV5_9BACT|nr:MAG: P-loop NTPase [Candidatus Mcinerneyibacterium aminivorans]
MSLKQTVVLSGKGGAGKTTLTATLAKLLKNKIIVDADVDAADMFILMKPKIEKKEKFKGKPVAKINQQQCIKCGKCMDLCRFDAINLVEGDYKINEYMCDGCTLCDIACPVDAIDMLPQIVGEWYKSKTNWGDMVHAKLYPGAENSGNLVTMVKHQAKLIAEDKNIGHLLIDGPPGIGCPVNSSLSGAHYAILVTEPTQSGLHDLKRIFEVSKHFDLDNFLVINKYDINNEMTGKILEFAEKKDMKLLGKIPFDKRIVNAQVNLQTPVDLQNNKELKKIFNEIFKKFMENIKGE